MEEKTESEKKPEEQVQESEGKEEQISEDEKNLEEKEKFEEFQGTKCEIFTRCVGYIRPVEQMNEGKVSEVKERVMFQV